MESKRVSQIMNDNRKPGTYPVSIQVTLQKHTLKDLFELKKNYYHTKKTSSVIYQLVDEKHNAIAQGKCVLLGKMDGKELKVFDWDSCYDYIGEINRDRYLSDLTREQRALFDDGEDYLNAVVWMWDYEGNNGLSFEPGEREKRYLELSDTPEGKKYKLKPFPRLDDFHRLPSMAGVDDAMSLSELFSPSEEQLAVLDAMTYRPTKAEVLKLLEDAEQ